ncbi:MAG: lamin tail domain-containing protein [Candidatus Marinimicrobia bacterium]|nr:lamin tail domain-containing protein [Candidatus Neomarinimicrobiota bacterium]
MKKIAMILMVLSVFGGVVFGAIIISEIMQNPSKVTDSNGEWFEVYNSSSSPINLNGWRIKDNGSDSHIISGDLIVPPKGFAVLGNNTDFSTNGGVIVNYQFPSTFYLGNNADELIILDDFNNEIDKVEWDGGTAFPDPNGASMVFIGNVTDNNNIGSNWKTATTPWGTGTDLGSPGYSGADQSLPVTLSSFTATPDNGTVLLRWTTESEVNNLGFNLYKSDLRDGDFVKLNDALIEGAGNSTTKNDYSYTDIEVVPGKIYYYQIEDVAFDGKTEKHPVISVILEKTDQTTADSFRLMPAYPNPFNPETTIKFQVPEKSTVSINIFDLRGQWVKSLVSENKLAGHYEVKWNGTDAGNNPVSNGIYFYQMTTGSGFSQTQKIMFLK